jgi:short-subunit dehydrogenase involved in D-alanine esterification of teichoic acids
MLCAYTMTKTENRVAVITGSNSGVGLATAMRLLEMAAMHDISLTVCCSLNCVLQFGMMI